jgi:DNA-binding MarR family transcriptional regulator
MIMDETILGLIYLAHARLAALENTPRDYGTGELLFSSDIHTVVAVADHEGCNLTELAVNLGVSNPAAFKFAAKMVRLGYLIKERRDGNRKDVIFSLSKKGRQANLAHAAFERRTFGPLQDLERKLPVGDKKVILDFLGRLNQSCAW